MFPDDMKYIYKILFLLIISGMMNLPSYAQDNQQRIKFGLSYGIGTQQIFPYNSRDYIYNVSGYRIQVNRTIKIRGAFTFELQFEPGIYIAKHRLLNEFFVQPKDLEQREIFTREKTITEYVLNTGFQVRYRISQALSLFLLGGVGPMFSDTETERLARGFAFSDVVAVGIAYRSGKFMFELRPGLRHVSNADLKYPNCGHNSSNIDFAFSVFL